jgi:preprotein translocase subunit SecG
MQNVLIVIHLIIVVALVGVVLLQRSEGGGLGMGSGGGGGVGGFMTGRGQANALTRATAILAGLFFITSLTLAVLATQGRTQRSIIDGAPPPPAQGAPATPGAPSAPNAGGGVLDQLRQLENNAQPQAQPPQPSAPAQ